MVVEALQNSSLGGSQALHSGCDWGMDLFLNQLSHSKQCSYLKVRISVWSSLRVRACGYHWGSGGVSKAPRLLLKKVALRSTGNCQIPFYVLSAGISLER